MQMLLQQHAIYPPGLEKDHKELVLPWGKGGLPATRRECLKI